MDIYLMQHGEAAPAEADPARPLTDAGRRSVAVVSAHAAARGVRLDRIVHSGKLRAEQTAVILAGEIGCAVVEQVEGLTPNADVQAAADVLIEPLREGALAVVGHLPFLDRFASLLVVGDPGAHVVALRNGGLVKLIPDERGFAVAWAITPEIVGR